MRIKFCSTTEEHIVTFCLARFVITLEKEYESENSPLLWLKFGTHNINFNFSHAYYTWERAVVVKTSLSRLSRTYTRFQPPY
jgi:hypothetical protein